MKRAVVFVLLSFLLCACLSKPKPITGLVLSKTAIHAQTGHVYMVEIKLADEKVIMVEVNKSVFNDVLLGYCHKFFSDYIIGDYYNKTKVVTDCN